MSEKQFPPTELKLQKLRQLGIFAFSKDVTTAAVIGAAAGVATIFPWEKLFQFLKNAFEGKEGSFPMFLELFLQWGALLVCCSLGCVITSWMLQTKFYFRWRRVGIDRPAFRSFGEILAQLIKSCFWICICAVFFTSYAKQFLATGRVEYDALLFMGAAAMVLSFLVGVLSRFVAGLNFAREHRMSRADIEAESRENEIPRFVREALASRIELLEDKE